MVVFQVIYGSANHNKGAAKQRGLMRSRILLMHSLIILTPGSKDLGPKGEIVHE